MASIPGRFLRGIRQKWDFALFCVGALGLAFAFGVAVERYRIFPYGLIDDAAAAVDDWRDNWRHYLEIQSKYLVPATQTKAGVTRYDPAAASPGHTFLTLFRGDLFGATLIDMEGKVLHSWNVKFSEVFPDPKHLEVAPPDFDVVLHGTALLPNGDVILTMEGVGANLVRDGLAGVVTGAERFAPEQLTFLGGTCG